MKKILFTIAMAMLMQVSASWAQEINPKEIIKDNLEGVSADELEDAEQKLEKAEQMLRQALDSKSGIDKMRADAKKEKKGKQKKINKQADAQEGPILTKMINAYTMMEKAQGTIYNTYKLDIENKLVDVPDSKLDRVSQLLESSENSWTQAENAKTKIPTDKKATQQQIASAREKVVKYQKDAINQQIENYVSILGMYDKPEPKVDEFDIPEVDEPVVQTPMDRIHYKVQIAADNAPLTLEFIQKYVYNTSEVINNEYTDGTYRYLVGRYDTYEEAKAAKERMRVKGAFVVRYKNGKRMEIIDDDNY